jgi:hypothetical protein
MQVFPKVLFWTISFPIYINDINNNILLFADDTSLFVAVENDHVAAVTFLTEELNVISNWIKRVQFNPKKNTVFSRSYREHPPIYFGLNGDEIEEIDKHCYLGVTFQSTATWKTTLIFINRLSLAQHYMSAPCRQGKTEQV